MIINYDYKNLRENLFNLKRFFENLGKLIKIKSRSCIENLFNFIFILDHEGTNDIIIRITSVKKDFSGLDKENYYTLRSLVS